MKISGKVIRGKGKGKTLGFPTANLELTDKIESGVYGGKVITREYGANGKLIRTNEWLAGIFVNPEGTLLEAHIIGFSGDLYGKKIKIELGDKIRNIIKFESEEELREQIKKDIKSILAN